MYHYKTMYPLFVLGSLGVTIALAWVTYQSGRLLRSVPITENLLLGPVENVVKAVLVFICIGLGFLSGLPYAQLGWNFDNALRDAGLGIVVGMLSRTLVNALTLLAISKWGKDIYSPGVK